LFTEHAHQYQRARSRRCARIRSPSARTRENALLSATAAPVLPRIASCSAFANYP
jgi:hypothetical protein